MLFHDRSIRSPQRRGTLLPAIALALIVVGGAMALVLDQLWIATARRELQTAADAAALAAGRQLVVDDLLLDWFDKEWHVERIRAAAARTASQHTVAARPAVVDANSLDDIRLGRPVTDETTGQTVFLETGNRPTSVLITAHADRRSGNPVSLFMPYLTGQRTADVIAVAEASVSHQVSGVRPFPHANAPVWPIGILEQGGREVDDWLTAIESGWGVDRFSWDADQRTVSDQPDGLPEMTLRTATVDNAGNVRVLDLGSQLMDDVLQSQFRDGLSRTHLEPWGGALRFAEDPLELDASRDFSGMPIDELQQQIGQARLVLLYSPSARNTTADRETLIATRLVAIRVLELTDQGDYWELTVQPAVIATRTAILSDPTDQVRVNPYLYKLALTQK